MCIPETNGPAPAIEPIMVTTTTATATHNANMNHMNVSGISPNNYNGVGSYTTVMTKTNTAGATPTMATTTTTTTTTTQPHPHDDGQLSAIVMFEEMYGTTMPSTPLPPVPETTTIAPQNVMTNGGNTTIPMLQNDPLLLAPLQDLSSTYNNNNNTTFQTPVQQVSPVQSFAALPVHHNNGVTNSNNNNTAMMINLQDVPVSSDESLTGYPTEITFESMTTNADGSESDDSLDDVDFDSHPWDNNTNNNNHMNHHVVTPKVVPTFGPTNDGNGSFSKMSFPIKNSRVTSMGSLGNMGVTMEDMKNPASAGSMFPNTMWNNHLNPAPPAQQQQQHQQEALMMMMEPLVADQVGSSSQKASDANMFMPMFDNLESMLGNTGVAPDLEAITAYTSSANSPSSELTAKKKKKGRHSRTVSLDSVEGLYSVYSQATNATNATSTTYGSSYSRSNHNNDDDDDNNSKYNEDLFPEKWNEKYQQLVQFQQLYGHCNVQQYHCPKGRNNGGGDDDNDDDDDTATVENPDCDNMSASASCNTGNGTFISPRSRKWASLGRWVKRQRYQYKRKQMGKHHSLTEEREFLLNQLNNFQWDVRGNGWQSKIDELQEFIQQHGHANVPATYKANPSLGRWLKRQRAQYKLYVSNQTNDSNGGASDTKKGTSKRRRTSSLTPERIEQLESMGVRWYGQRTGTSNNNKPKSTLVVAM